MYFYSVQDGLSKSVIILDYPDHSFCVFICSPILSLQYGSFKKKLGNLEFNFKNFTNPRLMMLAELNCYLFRVKNSCCVGEMTCLALKYVAL